MVDQWPLRVRHHSDDVLFFLHIPKTAGMSLIAILDAHFAPEEIFPLHSAPHSLSRLNTDVFGQFSREQLQQYRLVRGHFVFGPEDNGVYQHITPHPIRLTMLRDPVARTLSSYQHNLKHGHIPATMSLEQFVTGENTYFAVVNHQTRLIAGKVKGTPYGYDDPAALPPEEMLSLAQNNLADFAFFGLTERFREAMQLLTYTFEWQPRRHVPQENVSENPLRPHQLPPFLLEAIQERTLLDQALYTFAAALFQERYEVMLEALLHNRTMFAETTPAAEN